MRNLVRKILTWLLVFGIGAIAIAVLGEWFIEVARDKGWYANAGQRWDRLVGAITAFVTSGTFLYPLTALAGLVAGLWIDYALKGAGDALARVRPTKGLWEATYRKVRAMQRRLEGFMQTDCSKVPDDLPYEILSLHASLRRVGIPTPDKDRDRWPPEAYFRSHWEFLTCIAPFMRDKHKREARRSAQQHLSLIESPDYQSPIDTEPGTRP